MRSFVTQSLLHRSVAAISLAVNLLAVLLSLKAAFWDARLEPVAILPAKKGRGEGFSGRRRAPSPC